MQLQDAYNSSIQRCNNAVMRVQQSNEFLNAQVTANGVVYSEDLHSQVTDASFLSVFLALESFLEKSFVCYMLGQVGLNGNAVPRFATPANEEHAINMLRGAQSYPDFTTRDTVMRMANLFFDNGGPFSYLNSIAADFIDMKKIRNAISHTSAKATDEFEKLVRLKIGSLPPHCSTAAFLNATVPDAASTFFIKYEGIAVNAINNIANP